MAEPALERIFLYGTLRRGGSRDALTHYEGTKFLRAARVRGELYDFDAYPGLRLTPEGGWVAGDLFDVTPAALAKFDDWEGIDPSAPDRGEYRRVEVSAEREDGVLESCWIYEIAEQLCAGRSRVPSGDWLAYDAARR